MRKGKEFKGFALDFDTIMRNGALAQRLVDGNKLTRQDIEMSERYGDPYNKLASAIKSAGLKREKGDKTYWPQDKYLWLVILPEEGNKVVVYESSFGFFSFMDGLRSAGEVSLEELFAIGDGVDVLISATGKGFQRKYTFQAARKNTDVSPATDAKFPDLLDIHDSRAVSYSKKVYALFDEAEELLDTLGITKADFGQ
jgi:hypothetical protein